MSERTRLVGGLSLAGLLVGLAFPVLAQITPETLPEAPAPSGVADPVDADQSPEAPGADAEALPLRPGIDALPDEGSGEAPPAAADMPPINPDLDAIEANRARLSEIENSITLTTERAAELRAEIEDLQGDRARQNAALIAAGQRVKLAEIEIGDMEERLGELIASELEVRGRLDGADGSIANVLAALERISRNPPPALIVDPSDALGSARSAMLISAILPQLRAQADAVSADLAELQQIKAAALEEEQLLRANFAILEEEQLRIATLIAARRQGETRATAELEETEREAIALAETAADLQELIEGLSARITAVATAASATAAANAGAPTPSLDSDTVRLALANTARVEPAVPFSSARGHLVMPATGQNVIDYGAGDGFGGISRGLSILTPAEAQVVAPADGWVLYRGPYLNYGQIIILNTGQDYTMLLAGLAEVTVDIGQFVLMGEPVGSMGSQTIGRTVTTSAGADRPTLYIEMRRNNEPVDPTGWWASPRNLTQSG
ncbi:hypothetical protein EMQ25_11805 [Arsenicitalea aurantiaca]|uniref:M23ase beta-sheet core domain-containing protein n=1 Tax=Arsenicitalea aurantiaca TaxID=1783274 RepID=A0A433X7I1_9HYPH|nr:peptidoglycan DD-metalloendopeptidase family protein [Arsenicitalea aurantiaca]RUT30012.1 hypothetical protein EMQ25_11805 [Arsenicitalea aurantiaca]